MSIDKEQTKTSIKNKTMTAATLNTIFSDGGDKLVFETGISELKTKGEDILLYELYLHTVLGNDAGDISSEEVLQDILETIDKELKSRNTEKK